jgi:hypothetical protein
MGLVSVHGLYSRLALDQLAYGKGHRVVTGLNKKKNPPKRRFRLRELLADRNLFDLLLKRLARRR